MYVQDFGADGGGSITSQMVAAALGGGPLTYYGRPVGG